MLVSIQCLAATWPGFPCCCCSLAVTESDSSHSTDEMKELEVRGDLCDNDLSCSFAPNFKHDHAMINITIENWIKEILIISGCSLSSPQLSVKSQVGDLTVLADREGAMCYLFILPR